MRYVLGCISQLREGQYSLEDVSGSVLLDLQHAETTSGLYSQVQPSLPMRACACQQEMTRFLATAFSAQDADSAVGIKDKLSWIWKQGVSLDELQAWRSLRIGAA